MDPVVPRLTRGTVWRSTVLHSQNHLIWDPPPASPSTDGPDRLIAPLPGSLDGHMTLYIPQRSDACRISDGFAVHPTIADPHPAATPCLSCGCLFWNLVWNSGGEWGTTEESGQSLSASCAAVTPRHRVITWTGCGEQFETAVVTWSRNEPATPRLLGGPDQSSAADLTAVLDCILERCFRGFGLRDKLDHER